MAREAVVALVGAGAGPMIPIFKKESIVRVTGLTRGEIKIFNHGEHKYEVMRVSSNGDFPVPDGCAVLSAACPDAEDSLIILIVRN